MRSTKTYFFKAIGLALALCSSSLSLAQTKHALVIAIGNYQRQTGWPIISSENDIPLVAQVLRAQQFKDVVVLKDQQADRKGIVDAMRALINRVQKGDKVVVHFSSHGQQIADQNGDEADAYDEAIVCYGAPQNTRGAYANYTGDQHLRDEDLGALLNELRAKLGSDGDVLLVVDACHSGTITRGSARLRGGGPPLKINNPRFTIQKGRKNQKARPIITIPRIVSQTGMAPYVAISASRASESNSECYLPDEKTPVGSLTYALNQALLNPKKGESYQDMFDRVRSVMKQKVPSQTPEIEGDVDRELFGGKAVVQEPYLTITDVKDGGRKITVGSGQLTGLFDSTKVVVCATPARDPHSAPVLASGYVVKADLYAATIQLDKPVDSAKATDYRVFVTEQSSGDLRVGLRLDSLRDPALRQRIKTGLGLNKLIRFDGSADLVLFQDASQRDSIGLRRATDGQRFGYLMAPDGSQTSVLKTQIQRYAQSQFLQSFAYTANPSVQIRAELIPLKKGAKTTADTTSRQTYMNGSWLGFAQGDTAVLLVTNTGSTRIYYTVVDITPTGEVAVILPNSNDRNDRADSYAIAPGQSLLVNKRIWFEPPYGKETFKLFATLEPVDLRQVVGRSRGSAATRGNMDRLAGLFDDTNDMVEKGYGTRGTGTGSFPADANIATYNIEFMILDKKPMVMGKN